MTKAPLVLLALLLAGATLAPVAAAPAREAHGTFQAHVGRWMEAVPAPAEDEGHLRWTNGRSNVQALWVFEPARPTPDAGAGGDAVAASTPLADGMPLELRTARDLTGAPMPWTSHLDCGVTTYRGLLALPGGALFHYEACDGATEIYLAPTPDLRRADRALLATVRAPGPQATPEAYEARVGGVSYAFVAAPAADAVVLRQARLVPLGESPVTVEVRSGVPLLILLHDVVE